MRHLTCLTLMLTLLAGCELDGEGPSQAPEGNATSFELDSKPVGDASRAPYESQVQSGIEIRTDGPARE